MNNKIKILFISFILVAGIVLSGCINNKDINNKSTDQIASNTDQMLKKENTTIKNDVEKIVSNIKNNSAANKSVITNNRTTANSISVTNDGSLKHSNNSGSSDSNSESSELNIIITDLAERTVTIPTPDNIQKVTCLHPIPTYMTWRLTPNKLNSVDMVFNSNPRLVPSSTNDTLNSLPVTGVYFKGMNREQMLSLHPDIIVSLNKDPNLDQEQMNYSAPIIAISKDNLTHYEQSFRLLGKALGNEKDANELADYWTNNIKKVTDKTSNLSKVKVYYASHDGPLSTVGPLTVMSSIIDLAGGIDMYDTNTTMAPTDKVNERIIVNIEKILMWNPDVIITKTEAEKNTILEDPQWKPINAVKDGKVYAVPRWETLDGIQSIMGLMWTAEKLHPDKVDFDFNNETRAFYSKFYLYNNITDEQIAQTAT